MDEHKISTIVSDQASDNLRKLTALFPSIMKDGEVDLEALKDELGIFEEVEKESYELTWAGKQRAKKIAAEPVFGRTLKYVPEESKNPETTENLYIEGDNLEVLKLLQNSYMGKIKMIYIDPPYNTGNDFIYKDKFSVSERENSQAEGDIDEFGNRYVINTKSSGRYHANWLSMMYPRLRLAKNLLRDDGVIFVSIDDNEMHNLRNICDDIYGTDNFIDCLKWKRKKQPSFLAKHTAKVMEYILVYSKNFNELEKLSIEETTDSTKKVINISNRESQRLFKKGVRVKLNGTGIIPKGRYTIRTMDVEYLDDVHYSNNKTLNEVVVISKFAESQDNIDRYIDQNLLFITSNYGLRRDVSDEELKRKSITDLLLNEWGDNQESDKEMREIFNRSKFFEYTKSIKLLRNLVKSCYTNDSTILDFFAGSSSTAHAVMHLNSEDDGKRKFIMVQYPEPLDIEYNQLDNQEAIDFCDELGVPRTISEIGKERIRRAGDKILAESGKEIDIGFKVFKTADTNIRWIAQENGMQISQTHLDDTAKSVLDRRDFMPDATDIDVAYEILLRQWDIPLSATMEALTDIGQRTYCFADTVVVCLEEEVTREIVDKIASIEPMPHKVIFRDSAFGKNISLKLNTMKRFDAMMKRHGEKTKQAYTVEFL